jgi:hypothetical protein
MEFHEVMKEFSPFFQKMELKNLGNLLQQSKERLSQN